MADSFFKDLARMNPALLRSSVLGSSVGLQFWSCYGGFMNRVTHFEQVSLDAIRNIIEINNQSEAFAASPEVNVERVRVLLADDSDLVRAAIRRFLLDGNADIELVGEAVNFAQTIEMSNQLKPHVIVMDVRPALTDEQMGQVISQSA